MREVWVMECRKPSEEHWGVLEAFESERVARATCADVLEGVDLQYPGADYRVSRYVPAQPGV